MIQSFTPPPTRIRGTVEKLFACRAEFTSGILRADGNTRIRFAGPMPVQEHLPVVLHGEWHTHPTYGRQLRVAAIEVDLDLDPAGLAKYLAHHPDLKGIGPKKAKRIAELFGRDFAQVLAEHPERIVAEAKVPAETIEFLRQEWQQTRTTNTVMVWLSAFGLSHRQVSKLIETFGNGVVSILQADPYRLIRAIPGLGFARVDQVALQLGIALDDPVRLRAALLHCLAQDVSDGHCWSHPQRVLIDAEKLLALPGAGSSQLTQALESLISDQRVVCPRIEEQGRLATASLYRKEQQIHDWVQRWQGPNPHFYSHEVTTALAGAPHLNDDQRQALLLVLSQRICAVLGGAGTGKTYTMATVVRHYQRHGLSVALAAPTGKAAKRLEQLTGHEASTIHRLLGYNGERFKVNRDNPLEVDVVLCDEASMVDVPLAWQLFDAIDFRRTALVLVGDPHQLPPVGPGNLLRDLTAGNFIPSMTLQQVVRQAGSLKENSLAILAGRLRGTTATESGVPCWIRMADQNEQLATQRTLLELHAHSLCEHYGFDLIRDVQVLTPTHKGPLGTQALNIELQRLIQKKLWNIDVPPVDPGRKPKFLVGDKVIWKRNDYGLELMNGTMGQVIAKDATSGDLVVRFADREIREIALSARDGQLDDLQLAYIMTIHSSQGSEFPCAIVIADSAHWNQLHRNLLYTGVTRAQQCTVILGDERGLRHCLSRSEHDRRRTFLSLWGENGGAA